jgi:hypothetical protein
MDAGSAECDHHLQGLVFDAANPGSDVGLEDAMLGYAGCMREQGIDMPDPDLSSGMIRLGKDAPGEMEEFEAAHEECREILAGVEMDF